MSSSEQNKEAFKTKNLNLAAFLVIADKVKLIGIDKTNPKEFWFVFTPLDLCEELETTYWTDRATVNPKRLFYAFNELRDRIFN